MIIADTSGLLAFFNKREPAHTRVAAAVEKAQGPLIVSPFVVAELDYLLATRVGVEAELQVLRELAAGAYELSAMGAEDLSACADVIARYSEQEIGVTDASLVVLAQRHKTKSILTLDSRHFRVLRPLDGGHFKLLGP